MNTTALATRTEELMFMPVMDLQIAIDRRNHLVKFVQSIMKENTDYGKIPGAGDKPTLLKPGAEKLATFFGLTPMFIPISVTEDWTGDEHKGEPFFYYRYRCELHRNGNLIASSEGSCNTWESKYRYRKGERICPNCGQAAIIKGKAEYGGGWICFGKKGGCGTKFLAGDASIESQEVGRILNPDVADQVNTVQKMAQKRALIAATLLAVNASEFFTQDIEDMVIEGEWSPVVESKQPQAKAQGRQQPQEPPTDNGYVDPDVLFAKDEPAHPLASKSQTNKMHALGVQFHGSKDAWDKARHVWVNKASGGKVESSSDLSPEQAQWVIDSLEKRIAETQATHTQQPVSEAA